MLKHFTSNLPPPNIYVLVVVHSSYMQAMKLEMRHSVLLLIVF